jgi:hypothetical protein
VSFHYVAQAEGALLYRLLSRAGAGGGAGGGVQTHVLEELLSGSGSGSSNSSEGSSNKSSALVAVHHNLWGRGREGPAGDPLAGARALRAGWPAGAALGGYGRGVRSEAEARLLLELLFTHIRVQAVDSCL